MNGIGLLVLIAAAGQLNTGQPFSTQLPAQPFLQNQPTAIAQNRDWGWEFDKENTLCFIVQISEQKLKEMIDTGWELPSDMPEELVGRATRITVRIGTNLLPQNPSLDELKKMPRVNTRSEVTAQLGPGRISDVESENLQHVQQDRSVPALPSPSSLGANAAAPQFDAQANLADQLKAASNAIGEKAKSLVPGTPNIPDGRAGLGLESSRANSAAAAAAGAPPGLPPSFPGAAAAPSRFNSPAIANAMDDRNSTTNPATNWAGTPDPYGQNAYQQQLAREEAARLTDSRLASPLNPNSGYTERTTTSTNGNYNPGGLASGAYDSRDPNSLAAEMFNRLPQQQTPGGFGGFPGAGNQAAFTNSNGQLNGNYADPYANPASSGFSNNLPLQNDFAGSPASRMASSNTGGSGSPSMISPVTTSLPTGTSTNSNDFAANANDETPSAAKSKAADNILPVLFLLSLIVNFYLGMILRKLLVRYRAAVANNRGLISPNAYS